MRSLLLGLCLLLGGCSQWLFYPQAGLPVTMSSGARTRL